MEQTTIQGAAEAQYKTADRLNTRISIHEKYSTNPQGFGRWITAHYRFEPGVRVLELGCGTGSMWLGQDELIKRCRSLVLSDFSEGMLTAARETLHGYGTIEYRRIDIQDIPYPAASFDAVIANMMLYHVPDLDRGLSEVRRVLKEGGCFYCATYGEKGILPYLCSSFDLPLGDSGLNLAFTLQNGEQTLRRHFERVERYDYLDSLAVTNVEDLVDYIRSLTGVASLRTLPRERLRAVLQSHMVNGVLTVPKDYGMFIAM